MRLVFDVEADNLLDDVTKIHCIVAKDRDTGEIRQFNPERIDEGLAYLSQADELCGLNILGYDIPALGKVRGWKPAAKTKCRDLLVESRLRFSDLSRNDLDDEDEEVQNLDGGHSLEAWGVRLGVRKMAFKGPWDVWTQEMQDYCVGDVEVAEAICQHFDALPCSQEALDLEHEFAQIAEDLHHRGFSFDTEGAMKLCAEIEAKADILVKEFKNYAPDTFEDMKKAAYWVVTWPDGTRSEFPTKGAAEQERKDRKVKPKDCQVTPGPVSRRTIEFNPRSDMQVREYLFRVHRWLSPNLTEKGEELLKSGEAYDALAQKYGSIKEDLLRTLDFPEAEILADYRMLLKRLSQIRDGKGGWLKKVKPDGKIHHRMLPIGTATFRVAHSGPNLSQVPHVLTAKDGRIQMGLEGRYGAECRALFHATEGMVLVGTDLSGIEARLLAAYLKRFDGGKYIQEVLSGDIHSLNVNSIKKFADYTVSRTDSKTFFYAKIYGAGAEKLGKGMVSASEEAKAEFLSLVEELSRNTARNCERIASLVCWGRDTPVDRSDWRFKRTNRSAQDCKNLQDATYLAHSVVGGRVSRAIQSGIAGFPELLDSVAKVAERGYLEPLDGHRVPVRSPHSALNSLLQASAAIVAKKWAVATKQYILTMKLNAWLLIFAHDELQAEVSPEHTEMYQTLCLRAIRETGEYYRLPILLEGESKVGKRWVDTH